MTGMKLRGLRAEIEESAKSLSGEKAYPITSDWIPLTDVIAIIDRFEKEWHKEFEATLSEAESCSHQQLKEIVQRIMRNLLA